MYWFMVDVLVHGRCTGSWSMYWFMVHYTIFQYLQVHHFLTKSLCSHRGVQRCPMLSVLHLSLCAFPRCYSRWVWLLRVKFSMLIGRPFNFLSQQHNREFFILTVIFFHPRNFIFCSAPKRKFDIWIVWRVPSFDLRQVYQWMKDP